VLAYFPDALDLVLDGGPTAGGAPSTVVDVTADPPRVLRQGAITLGP
jgi:L-threonylcarbamoyladenylate synthase